MLFSQNSGLCYQVNKFSSHKKCTHQQNCAFKESIERQNCQNRELIMCGIVRVKSQFQQFPVIQKGCIRSWHFQTKRSVRTEKNIRWKLHKQNLFLVIEYFRKSVCVCDPWCLKLWFFKNNVLLNKLNKLTRKVMVKKFLLDNNEMAKGLRKRAFFFFFFFFFIHSWMSVCVWFVLWLRCLQSIESELISIRRWRVDPAEP